MSWTDERVETLKKMWGEGQSASVIAKELGGVTRNAVIGKVHRLGLSNRTASNAPAPKAAAPIEPAKPQPTPTSAPKPAAAPVAVDPPRPLAVRKIIPAGQQIGLMIFSSDRDFTLWPDPGTKLTVDLDATSLSLPIVGGTMR